MSKAQMAKAEEAYKKIEPLADKLDAAWRAKNADPSDATAKAYDAARAEYNDGNARIQPRRRSRQNQSLIQGEEKWNRKSSANSKRWDTR